jgi:hypothetical protein
LVRVGGSIECSGGVQHSSKGFSILDDDETLTAYHESGHAVIAYALGGHIASMQLGGEADDWLPQRFGDCRIAWGRVDPNLDWQIQREVLAILAGPVAEMTYRSEPLHPSHYGPWQHDWQHAWTIGQKLVSDQQQRTRMLEELVRRLHRVVESEPCWSAIAALADELAAHEYLEADQIEDVIGFWFRSGT